MVFTTKTAPPATVPVQADKQEEIKSLLFQAVKLFVEGNESAREELLVMLSPNTDLGMDAPVQVTS